MLSSDDNSLDLFVGPHSQMVLKLMSHSWFESVLLCVKSMFGTETSAYMKNFEWVVVYTTTYAINIQYANYRGSLVM